MMKNAFCPATALYGSGALPFVAMDAFTITTSGEAPTSRAARVQITRLKAEISRLIETF